MKRVVELLNKAYRDEQGAEGLEKLLIVAAIVLPLLGLLIYFRDWITEWVSGEADTLRTDADDDDAQNPGF